MIRGRARVGGAALALTVLAVIGPADTSGAQQVVYEVPASIDSTGSEDVTAALNEFLAEVPDGAVAILGEAARYRVEGTLVLEGRSDLTIDGNGATILSVTAGDQSRSHLSIEGGERIAVHDLIIRGAHPAAGVARDAWQVDKAFQHGIRILGASDVEIRRVLISDVYGDHIYVGRGDEGEWSERVWIHDSTLTRNGRHGIALTAAEDVLIAGNDISQTRHATIDLEPGTEQQGVRNVHILDNRIGAGRLRFVAAHGNGPVNEVVIARNEAEGRDLAIDVVAAAQLDRRQGFWVLDNESDVLAAGPPIRFGRVDGVVVRGNSQHMRDEGEPAIELDAVCGVSIGDNDFGEGTPAVARTGAPCGEPPPVELPPAPTVAAPVHPVSTSTTEAAAIDDEAADIVPLGDGDGATPDPGLEARLSEAATPSGPAASNVLSRNLVGIALAAAGVVGATVLALQSRRRLAADRSATEDDAVAEPEQPPEGPHARRRSVPPDSVR